MTGRSGITTVETIGAVSVIGMLASILVPSLTNAVKDAKLAAEVSTIANLKSATTAYFERYGKIAGVGGAALATWLDNANEYWDRNVLLAEQLLDSPLRSALATNAYIRVVRITSTSTSTDILSSGSVGHLPAHNGNNGLYNFTAQYTCLPTVNPNQQWALTAPRQGWRALANRLAQAGPLLACYSVPSTWVAPPPGPGVGPDTDTKVSYTSQTGVDTQIAAPVSGTTVYVAELVLEGVSVADAYRLSRAIDGPAQSNWAYWDSLGRVKYDMYGTGGGLKGGEVFVYLGHK